MTYTTEAQTETTPAQTALVGKIIDGHAVVVDDVLVPIDTDCLVSVCLDCQSIAMAADEEQVGILRKHYDMTCCAPETTVYP